MSDACAPSPVTSSLSKWWKKTIRCNTQLHKYAWEQQAIQMYMYSFRQMCEEYLLFSRLCDVLATFAFRNRHQWKSWETMEPSGLSLIFGPVCFRHVIPTSLVNNIEGRQIPLDITSINVMALFLAVVACAWTPTSCCIWAYCWSPNLEPFMNNACIWMEMDSWAMLCLLIL